MTSPITPAPALHHDPTALQSFEHQVEAEARALQQMFSNILPGIIKEIVKALVPGAAGIVDELTTWEQNLLDGDWMRQLGSALTGIAEPGIKDIENWANSVRKFGQNIHLSDIIDLPDLFTLPVSHVGKPTTSPNLLTNADFSEAVAEQGPWSWDGPQLFCFSVGGTGEPTGTGNTAQVGSALNPAYWNWTPVSYSASLYPMQDSINDGISKLVAAIQTVPVGTKIALIGVSQGAVVTSKVWETEFVSSSGSLHNRLNDVVASVTFGNPRRMAGSHAAGTPDPGGHGIATNDLQTNVPTWWYDYADPDDIVPTVPDGAGGVYASQLYDFLTNTWNGDSDTLLNTVLDTFRNPAGTVSSTVELLEMIAGDAWKTLTGHNPHTSYNTVKIDGTNTSVQLAVSYLDSVGAANVGVSGTNFQNNSGGSGSVTVYANGSVEEWLHPDVITVAPEQTINVSAWAKVSGLTATGSPVIVGLTTFLDGTFVSKVDLGSIAGSTSWTQIVGTTYTVPSGVNQVQLRLKVDSTATAGQVWFDDLSLTKTGLLPTSHVASLNTMIQNLFGSLNVGSILQVPAIPNLDASKIISGVLDALRIPVLDASKIATGIFDALRIPTLDASKIATGIFDALRIPTLDASKIATGIFDALRIPGLDASKIISGVLAATNIPNITKAMSTDLQKMFGLYSTGKSTGANLVSNPGFENSNFYLPSWCSYSTDVAHAGTQSLKIVSDGTQNLYAYLATNDTAQTNIPCAANDVFYVECYVYGKSTNTQTSGGTVGINLGITPYNASGANLTGIYLSLTASTALNGVWTKLSGYITMPTGATSFNPFVQIRSLVTAGDTYYFDDVVVKEYTHSANINNAIFGSTTPGVTFLNSVIPNITKAMSTDLTKLFGMNTTKMAAGPNLATNPDFENSNFYAFGGAYSTAQKYTGSQSMLITLTSGAYGSLRFVVDDTTSEQYIPCTPTDVYYIEFWFYVDTAVVTPQGIWLQASGYDPSNTVTYSTVASVTPSSKGVWTKYSGYMNAPANAIKMSPYIIIGNGGATGDKYYIDKVSFYRVTETNQLTKALYNANSTLSTILATAVPSLDASKIVSGVLNALQIPNITKAMSTDLTKAFGFLSTNVKVGPNIATNPDFENSNYPLIGASGTLAYSTAQKHGGTQSLLCTMTNGIYALPRLTVDDTANVAIPTAPSDVYYVEFWVYAETTNVTNVTVWAQCNCYDNTGASLSGQTTPQTAPTKGSWVKSSGYITMPTNCATFLPYLVVNSTASTGDKYYFDDVKWYRITESNQLTKALYNANTTLSNILASVVPALDASKVTTGTFITSLIPNITKAMSTDLTNLASFFGLKVGSGSNLVPDPGFENASIFLSGSASFARSTDFAHTGTTSMKFVSTNGSLEYKVLGANDTTSLIVKCSPGDTIYAEVWVYGAAANVGTTGTIGLELQTFNSAGSFVANNPIASATCSTSFNSVWTKLSGYYQIPSGVYSFEPFVYGASVATGDTYYYDDVIVREVSEAQKITRQLFGGSSVLSNILAGNIPGLDASKIISGVLAATNIPNITKAMSTDLQSVITNIFGTSSIGTILQAPAIPGLDASKIISGILNATNIPNITKAMSTDLQSVITNIFGTSSIGTVLQAPAIPGLDASKIVSGILAATNIPNITKAMSTDLQSVISNIFGTSNIGTILQAPAIPGLDASKIISGILNATNIPNITKTMSTDLAKMFGLFGSRGSTGANVVSNPGFENSNFYSTSGSYTTAQKHSGTQSFMLTGSAGAFPGTPLIVTDTGPTPIPCVTNDVYDVSFWVYGNSANTQTGDTDGVRVTAEVQDTSGAYAYFEVFTGATTALNGAWTNVTGKITVTTANAASIQFYVQLSSNVNTGEVYYFDDVIIKEYTHAASINQALYGATTPQAKVSQDAVPDILRSMSQDLQDVIDGIHQAVNGGMSTGNTASTVKTNLQKFPWINLELLKNPSSATSVTLDAVGTGNKENNANSFVTCSTNWTHTIGSTANMLVATIVVESGPLSNVGYTSAFYRTVTCGSTDMTSILVSLGADSFTEVFVLPDPPAGAQTITATIHSTSNYLGGNFCDGVAGESVSLIGVGEIGATVTASGNGTAMSQTVTANSNAYIVQAFASEHPSNYVGASITGYNQTTDYYTGSYTQGIKNVGGVNLPTAGAFLAGHAPGASSVTFTATEASSGDNWYGIAVAFLPSSQAPIGVGMVQTRTSTTGFTMSSGYNITPNGYWDTQLDMTSDFTWDSTTGTVTIGYSGWYQVSLAFCGNGGTPSSQVRTRPTLYKNGTLEAVGGNCEISNSSTSFQGASMSTSIYLNAGDTLQTGYWSSIATTSCQLTGEANGMIARWAVVLENRSPA